MRKFAKLTETHRKVDPVLIPLSCSNQFQKKITKINFELDEYFRRATKRNIFSNFEQSQCLLWLPLLLTRSRHWSKNLATLFYYWNFLKAVVVIRYICNHLQVLFEKDYLKLRWRIPLVASLFLTKLLVGGLNHKTETLAQMHLCEFHETFKNTILYYTSW